MAQIYPDANSSRVVFASQAEEQFYEKCRNLPKSWSVYYSCTLSALEPGRGLLDNEIDFVLYHPQHGVFVIEVKGGQIKYDVSSGEFHSINRHGKSFSIRNPFQQALVWKSRFLRFMKGRGIKVPATHLVCFPNVVESDIVNGAEVEPMLILGRNRLTQLESYLQEVCAKVHPEKYLHFSDVRKSIDLTLKGASYSTKLYLRDYLDNHEMKVKDVETVHETLVTPIAGAQRLAIEGEAGTGKTLLAMILAKHFRNLGKKVLLLSSNAMLNTFLKDQVGEEIEVKTYAELASSYGVELLRRPAQFEGKRDDWIQYVGPERLKEAILASDVRYDVLLCDEAQDVQPFWWESIETVLRDEGESHFYIFFDRSQGVFGSGSAEETFIPEDVLPIDTPYFPLVNNYRTTREISTFSRSFRTGREILQSHSGRLGYVPELVVYEDEQDARHKLKDLLSRLYQVEGLSPQEVTLLSARKPFHDGSILHNHKKLGKHELIHMTPAKVERWTDKEMQAKTRVSTIAGFKGLETHVGIIVNLSEYNLSITNPIMSSLFYVASTRAKHMLYVMVKKGDDKHIAMKSALEKLDLSGSMTVDRTTIKNEFVGEVMSYNPSRVGWLKVDDSSLGARQIMFFPYDIKKASIFKVEAGMQIKFTPQLEGQTLIASNLSLYQDPRSRSRKDPEVV